MTFREWLREIDTPPRCHARRMRWQLAPAEVLTLHALILSVTTKT